MVRGGRRGGAHDGGGRGAGELPHDGGRQELRRSGLLGGDPAGGAGGRGGAAVVPRRARHAQHVHRHLAARHLVQGVPAGGLQQEGAPPYSDGKVASRDTRIRRLVTKKRSLNDGHIRNPSNSFGIVPLSNFVLRFWICPSFNSHSLSRSAKP